jgi:long-chain acyl-CoA synthetase
MTRKQTMRNSVAQLILDNAESQPNVVAQYIRDSNGGFRPRSYTELLAEVETFAAGLLELGLRRGEAVGIIADNRPEWLVADLALLGLGASDVPRGCDATADEISYILGHSECRIGIFENEKQLAKLGAGSVAAPAIEIAILLDAADEAGKAAAQKAGIALSSYAELIEAGKRRIATRRLEGLGNEFLAEVAKGRPDDVATIIYTSGTTGQPKGVMLEHRNFLYQADAILNGVLPIKSGHVFLSVLPVWHVFERIAQYMILAAGATIAYSKPIGSVMLADFKTVRPQWMASVPRIWESVQEGVYRNIRQQGGATKTIFSFFVGIGESYAYFKNHLLGRIPEFAPRSRILEIASSILPLLILAPLRALGYVLVFRKIKQKLGGRFIAGISGGGALPPSVDRFFDAHGIRILEGYGLTETAPVIGVRPLARPTIGTVGPLLEGIEIKIVDDAGKRLGPGHKGHIYVKGPQVMRGYFRDPERTAKAIDAEGWFDTGDLGLLSQRRELAIRGRAKDTIVLRGGENVEPAPIEARLCESDYILQAVVVGQDMRYLGALIVPREEAITAWAKENNVPIVDYESLLRQPEVLELIDAEIAERISPKSGFKSFERVFRSTLLALPFVEGRELSAKLELKRHVVAELYAKKIASLFEDEKKPARG